MCIHTLRRRAANIIMIGDEEGRRGEFPGKVGNIQARILGRMWNQRSLSQQLASFCTPGLRPGYRKHACLRLSLGVICELCSVTRLHHRERCYIGDHI